MRMTTEEAFVKTLQMHGIDNAFGIIGSAMMPISDIFPDAGIKFWDCAHETSGGMMADGFHPRHRQNVDDDRAKRSRHHKLRHSCEDRLLEPHAGSVGHAPSGQQDNRSGRLPRDGTDEPVRRLRCLPRRSPRPVPHRRDVEPRDHASQARLWPRPDQHPARLLDPGHRHRTACHRGL